VGCPDGDHTRANDSRQNKRDEWHGRDAVRERRAEMLLFGNGAGIFEPDRKRGFEAVQLSDCRGSIQGASKQDQNINNEYR